MMIHPTAIIHPSAQLASDVSVGAYSVIGADVAIGAGTQVQSHVVIEGQTRIGARNRIFSFCSIGQDPQDKKYAGEPTVLEIGNDNLFREGCTVNRGTMQGGGLTKIGDRNWIMAYVHIAHDCLIGSDNIFANNSSLAGHVEIDDFVILGGFTLISQFHRIGAHAFTAMGSVISRHVPPYVLVSGHMAEPVGVNVEGLKRRQFTEGQIRTIRQAYKTVYREGLKVQEAVAVLKTLPQEKHELDCLITFLETQQGGIIR